jgi:Flp pilus assembly protein TadG
MKRQTITPKSAASQSGAALLELALILPMLLVMALAVTELGRALWHYKVLAQSTREAARYLSTQTPGTGVEQARNLVLHGKLAGGGAYQLSGLTAAQPVRVIWQRQGSSLALVSVTVAGYRFDSLAATVFGVRLGPITFSDISASMRAASCGSVC